MEQVGGALAGRVCRRREELHESLHVDVTRDLVELAGEVNPAREARRPRRDLNEKLPERDEREAAPVSRSRRSVPRSSRDPAWTERGGTCARDSKARSSCGPATSGSERQHEHPSWPYRLMALAKLGYLPLLIAFWLA
jgi:hypothetical protein